MSNLFSISGGSIIAEVFLGTIQLTEKAVFLILSEVGVSDL